MTSNRWSGPIRKAVSVFVSLVALGAPGARLGAQVLSHDRVEGWLQLSVVRVVPHFTLFRAPQEGFGFVVREVADTLFVVTAKHVLFPEPDLEPDSTTVIFFDGSEARVRSVHSFAEVDLVVLNLPRPSAFRWYYRGALARDARVGDRVRIIGREGRWVASAEASAGQITSMEYPDIVADFAAARPGSSGGPMLSNDGVVGMVLNDEGDRVTALSVNAIKSLLYDLWGIRSRDITDLPFVILSAGIHGMAASPLNESPPISLGLEPTVSAEVVLRRGLGLGVRGSVFRLARSTTFEGQKYAFKNLGRRVTGMLCVYPGDALMGQSFDVGFFGVSRIWMDPQLQTPGAEARSLREIDPTVFSYSERAWSFLFGAGTNVVTPAHWLLRIEGEIAYTTAKYLSFDTGNPAVAMPSRDWTFTLGFSLGYVLRPAGGNARVVR